MHRNFRELAYAVYWISAEACWCVRSVAHSIWFNTPPEWVTVRRAVARVERRWLRRYYDMAMRYQRGFR